MIKYISFSAMQLFYQDRDNYVQKYLFHEYNRIGQTPAMAVGSAFDAFVKSYLFKKLVSREDPNYVFEFMFEQQVEPERRDQALLDGKLVFDRYNRSGALAGLEELLRGCVGEPRFEAEITAILPVNDLKIPILGKPDIYFINRNGARVIFDWKVNGFYSNHSVSPKPGYIKMLPGGLQHPNARVILHKGFPINTSMIDKTWATQTSTYAWTLGEEIGGDYIVAIDQVVCNRAKGTQRVARHASLVPEDQQRLFLSKYEKMWRAIQTGHIFFEEPKEVSDRRLEMLSIISEAD